MKPCSGNRKQLALLAIGALEIGRDQDLRAHLEACPPCRNYLAEISTIAAKLRAVEPESDIRASDDFHRKTLAAMKSSGKKSGIVSLVSQTRSLLNWRVALPAVALAAVVIAVLSVTGKRSGAISIPAPPARNASTPDLQANLAPTVANYEMVANQSLEKLDELITLQGRRNPPSMPVYTASTIQDWVKSD
jgi:anti-sigma factor RsiW